MAVIEEVAEDLEQSLLRGDDDAAHDLLDHLLHFGNNGVVAGFEGLVQVIAVLAGAQPLLLPRTSGGGGGRGALLHLVGCPIAGPSAPAPASTSSSSPRT